MKRYLLLIIISILPFILLSQGTVSEIIEFNREDVTFFIGDIGSINHDTPNFKSISSHEWVSLNFIRNHNILDEGKVWFKITIPKNLNSKNYLFVNSIRNNMSVYYPTKIYPKNSYQKNIRNLTTPGSFEGSIVPLEFNGSYSDNSDNIYISIDYDHDSPLFKYFPFVLGNKTALTSYVRDRELKKRRMDFGLFVLGNFLIVVGLISLIIFFFSIKNINVNLLLFSFLMVSAGIFYWRISPLSLIFSDFNHTRILTIIINYHLIWFFFGLLTASFFKKRILFLMPLLLSISLILSLIPFGRVPHAKLFLLAILLVFHFLLLYFIRKEEHILTKSKVVFNTATTINIIYLLISLLGPSRSIIVYLGPIGVGMLCWVAAFGHLILRQYNATINELHTQKIKNLELTETNLQSELGILKKQLDPHFLFNSLGALIALVETDQDLAVEYIEEFSSVYRYILDTKDYDFIRLEQELKFCDAYIYLIKIRFEDSIIVENNVGKQFRSFLVPPLSIQMLIENAIKHNIATPNKKLYLSINIDGNHLVVTNNIQIKKQSELPSKLGLKNLNQRLYLLRKLNIIVSESNDNFIVKIPLIKER